MWFDLNLRGLTGVEFEEADEEAEIDQWPRFLQIQDLLSDDLDKFLRQNFIGNFIFSCSFHLYPGSLKGDKK